MRRHLSQTTGLQRVLYGTASACVVGLLPLPLTDPSHILLAWTAGAMAYLGLSLWLALTMDAHRTRQRAQAQDPPGLLSLVLLMMSVVASAGAITVLLQEVRTLSSGARLGHLTLTLLALASSWLLMQTLFAFRYAHLYYHAELRGQAQGGGLAFPGSQAPDYFDFLYYAFVVGMTSQVSDVVVTDRTMRRLTLMHSVTAFAFNMLILALSINVIASVIQ